MSVLLDMDFEDIDMFDMDMVDMEMVVYMCQPFELFWSFFILYSNWDRVIAIW